MHNESYLVCDGQGAGDALPDCRSLLQHGETDVLFEDETLRTRTAAYWLAAVLLLLCGGVLVQAQANDQIPSDDQSSFQMKMESNLVLVPVVVRDASGNFVHGLTKADFKIFDQGKEQSIAQFEEEYAPAHSMASATSVQAKAAAPMRSALPGRFLTFFFDDLDSSSAELMQARDAADREIAAALQPEDRVAIFATGRMLSDFTADPRQIHAALLQLHRSAQDSSAGRPCPDLSDYQAQQLVEDGNRLSASWVEALSEAKQCNPTDFPPDSLDTMAVLIRMLSKKIASDAEAHARTSFQGFERALAYASKMPGARMVVMVSPGFLTRDMQPELDRIVDGALRSQIVINVLDPKGVATSTRAFNAAKHAEVNGPALTALYSVDADREAAVSDVLIQFTKGTGGELFHGNNDLNAGLGVLTAAKGRYILAFAPTDFKPDGKFHPLQVALVQPQKGYTLSSRRGYLVPKGTPQTASKASQTADPGSAADGKKNPATTLEAQESEQIREALYSQYDSKQLAVEWAAKAGPSSAGTRDVSLFSHLDLSELQLRRVGDRNVNRLTFVVAIFDRQEKVVLVEQRHATVNVPDQRLAELTKQGVDVDLTVQLKPGVYRFRMVVSDSEEHRLSAVSRYVSIP